jgi:hypothetical protein
MDGTEWRSARSIERDMSVQKRTSGEGIHKLARQPCTERFPVTMRRERKRIRKEWKRGEKDKLLRQGVQ